MLPLAAGILGLRLRNHLHAVTAVMICLILMVIQMHVVGSAFMTSIFNLLNNVRTFSG